MERQPGITVFLLVGGKGTRLLPLTATTPKPLLPITADGRTLLLRLLLQLQKTGCVETAVLCVGHGAVADALEEAAGRYMPLLTGDGETRFPLHLRIVRDLPGKQPGSAASVRAARAELVKEGALSAEAPIAVFCGDSLFDGDLHTFLTAFDRSPQPADAILLLAEAGGRQPTALGNVSVDKAGNILAFREKPSWGQLRGDPVSTGAYLLKGALFDSPAMPPLPDFGRDLWQYLLERDRPLRGILFDGYWQDVGHPEEYLSVCLRENGGKSLLMPSCTVGHSVRIRESVIGNDCRIGNGAILGKCIVGRGCRIGERAILQQGCVLGDGCSIGANAFLGEGTVLPPGSVVADHKVLQQTPPLPEGLFDDNRLLLRQPILGGSFPKRLGQALAEAAEGTVAGISEAGTPELRLEILQGVTLRQPAIDAGDGSRGMAIGFSVSGEASLTFHLAYAGQGCFSLSVFDRTGQYPGMLFERRLADALRRTASGDREPATAGSLTVHRGLRGDYLAALLSILPEEIDREILLPSDRDLLRTDRALLREAIAQRSCTPYKKPPLTLRLEDPTEAGKILSASEGELQLHPYQVTGILAGFRVREQASGKAVALPESCPEALKRMVRRGGARLLTLSHTCSDPCEQPAREAAATQLWLFDGCVAAATLLRILWQTGAGLRELAMLIPRFSCRELCAELEDHRKSALLRQYAAETEKASVLPDGSAGEGIFRADGTGYARLAARGGGRLLLQVEAADDADANALLRRARATLRRSARRARHR